MELVSCEDITFVNFFLFRVVAVDQPYETGIRLWDSRNITFMNLHNQGADAICVYPYAGG